MSDLQQRLRRAADTLRRTSMPLADLIPLLQQAADALEEQPAQLVPLSQILTDPENQPNQFGVEFLMHGSKFAFKVGGQQFTLDYEPTEPGEFEFMRDMLIHAMSIFTPDVKTAQAVPLLSVLEILDAMPDSIPAAYDGGMMDFARAIESLVRSKLGAGVGMTEQEIIDAAEVIKAKRVEIAVKDTTSRVGSKCSRCGGVLGADHNGYHLFNRCQSCNYVPMFMRDGSEFPPPPDNKTETTE